MSTSDDRFEPIIISLEGPRINDTIEDVGRWVINKILDIAYIYGTVTIDTSTNKLAYWIWSSKLHVHACTIIINTVLEHG